MVGESEVSFVCSVGVFAALRLIALVAQALIMAVGDRIGKQSGWLEITTSGMIICGGFYGCRWYFCFVGFVTFHRMIK